MKEIAKVRGELLEFKSTSIKAGDRCEGHQGCYSQKSTKAYIDAMLRSGVKSTRLGCK